MFQKQVFMVDQKWAVAFQGYLLLCKVLAVEVIDTKSLLNQEGEGIFFILYRSTKTL